MRILFEGLRNEVEYVLATLGAASLRFSKRANTPTQSLQGELHVNTTLELTNEIYNDGHRKKL